MLFGYIIKEPHNVALSLTARVSSALIWPLYGSIILFISTLRVFVGFKTKDVSLLTLREKLKSFAVR
jgi:hypothetical protein